MNFEWDEDKNNLNLKKHGVSFKLAQRVFLDKDIIIAENLDHSEKEERFFAIGKVENEIITVRFTYRGKIIRIFGAGYWRKGRRLYEKTRKIY